MNRHTYTINLNDYKYIMLYIKNKIHNIIGTFKNVQSYTLHL